MKKKLAALFASALLTVFGTTSVMAQGSPPWVIVPVDMWVCNLNDGRDMEDLDDWVEKFNEWADEQEDNTYAAWTLTPSYWGPRQDFDYIWLGAWTDANAMGQGWDNWNASNDGLMDEYANIASCRVHSNFASAAYRLPEGMDLSGDGVITISDCKRHHGVPGSAVDVAMRQWTGILDASGSNAAMYHWYPAFGGGGGPNAPDLDYKQVTSYANYSDLGADYERYGNGRLFEQNQALFDHLVSCDPARVYNAQSRRFVNVRGGQ